METPQWLLQSDAEERHLPVIAPRRHKQQPTKSNQVRPELYPLPALKLACIIPNTSVNSAKVRDFGISYGYNLGYYRKALPRSGATESYPSPTGAPGELAGFMQGLLLRMVYGRLSQPHPLNTKPQPTCPRLPASSASKESRR